MSLSSEKKLFMITVETVLYIMYIPQSVRGCRRQGEDHLTNYSHSMLQVGRSDSQYFKNISLSYLLPFYIESKHLAVLSEEMFFKSILHCISNRQCYSSHPWEYFTRTTMGLVLTFYLHSGGRPKSFLVLFDLMPETWYLTPTWKKFPQELQDQRGIGKEWENTI